MNSAILQLEKQFGPFSVIITEAQVDGSGKMVPGSLKKRHWRSPQLEKMRRKALKRMAGLRERIAMAEIGRA